MSEHDSFKSLHKIILEFIKVEHKNNNNTYTPLTCRSAATGFDL